MQVNAILSLIKSNTFDEAKALLEKTRKQPHFQQSENYQSIFRALQAFFLIKDKKFVEALEVIPKGGNVHDALMRAQLHLTLKQQKECVIELVDFVKGNSTSSGGLVSLAYRLAHNYKLVDLPEFTSFIQWMVSSQKTSSQVDIQLLEGLISIGQTEEAYKLIEKCDINSIKNDKRIMSLYISLLCEKDLDKAAKIQKELLVPVPSELLDASRVEAEGWTEEECVQKLIDEALPEKTKERKTNAPSVTEQIIGGGGAVFMPTTKSKKRVRYPKNYDPENPG